MSVDLGDDFSDRKSQSAEFWNDAEYRDVGGIVADENWIAVGKWRVGHQVAYRAGFADAGSLDLDDELSRQDFDGPRRGGLANLLDRSAQFRLSVWRQAIVQRQRIALVF